MKRHRLERQDSFAATPELPISTLLSPVVRLLPGANARCRVIGAVLLKSALSPLAVLLLPVVLFKSA
jgi:hypothetical protein